ncbi:hypothetical protein B1R32_13125 [Abditibacterium utsteinense]|uniref:Uncharacterized protein n=1 Tax=Abditibacterium utsteinense TaxID=1960156 RepID=A0A2S8SNY7_9BACT|nr:hypothetical protein [Abditibacterium utsteinense]PQV62512.1 hypothetical protein B1R32_13125 [Abditibacterium utsteinense]
MNTIAKFSYSVFISFVTGLFVAWPIAHQWASVLPWQRFNNIGLFFGISAVLSVVSLKVLGRVFASYDSIRAICLMLGAALCFSLVRQEVTLLVWPALWALPGTFLGSALGKFWVKRPTVSVTEAVPTREVELQSS